MRIRTARHVASGARVLAGAALVATALAACSTTEVPNMSPYHGSTCGVRTWTFRTTSIAPTEDTTGPLHLGPGFGVETTVTRPNFLHVDGNLALLNTSDQPIVLDAVTLGSPLNLTLHAPRLVACRVVADRPPGGPQLFWQPNAPNRPPTVQISGYHLPPHRPGGYIPVLALTMGPNGAESYSIFVDVRYHLLDGRAYVARSRATFTFCVQGKAPPSCRHGPHVNWPSN